MNHEEHQEREEDRPRATMGTQLLVSVRDADEAELAVVAGADLIDIKEPRHGSLGAASLEAIRRIAQCVGHAVPLSVALGELNDERSDDLVSDLPPGIRFAKVGLSNCTGLDDWPLHWSATLDRIPAHVRPVAVQYADWRSANAPAPDDLVAQAVELECAAVLIDTFDKSLGGLLKHWTVREVTRFVQQIHQRGMIAVVAGSLDLASINEVLAARPDFIAVRGAACQSDRTSRIDADKVRVLAQTVSGVRLTS